MDLTSALYHKGLSLKKTKLGLTNEIYLLEYQGQRYCLRKQSHEIINKAQRETERQVQLQLKDILDAEEIYFNKEKGIRITRWLDNIQTFQECEDDAKYFRAIKLIKYFHERVHDLKINFDLDKHYHNYLEQLKKPLFKYEAYEDIIVEFQKIEQDTPSHNDLVSGNILLGQKDYLIDYEYAANNTKYFDLMSFLSENQIYDPDLRSEIYFNYFETIPNERILNELKLTELAQDLLWSVWANLLYEKKKDLRYLVIASDKMQHLKEVYHETYLHHQ